jgi:hypothetical protein
MPGITEWLAVAVAMLGVLFSGVVALLAYSFTKQSQRAEMQREIGHLYDRLVDFRTAHPEVFALSRSWSETAFGGLYRQESEADRSWTLYYNYAELCCGFCNAVLYARRIGQLDRDAYERQYKSLVKLLLTEHYPYIQSVFHGKYLSPQIIDFVRKLEKEGWDWSAMHAALPGA